MISSSGAHVEDGGIVDQDVDTARRGDDLLHHGVDGGSLGDIQRQADRPAADRLGGGRRLLLQDIGDHDPGALGGEALADGGADPARPAGDDGDLVPKLHGTLAWLAYQQL